jgi:hypothetical protein
MVKRRERTRQETLQMIHHELFRVIRQRLDRNSRIEVMVGAIMEHKVSPYKIVEKVVSEWLPASK